MPQRRYTDIFMSSRLPYPERPRMPMPTERQANLFDFLSMAGKGIGETYGAYQQGMMNKIKMDEAEKVAAERKAAREGREAFRKSLIDGKQVTSKSEVVPGNGPGDDENPFKWRTETRREDLSPNEMVDSYLKNVPMSDDTDAKGMMGLLIDKNKPMSQKMKEVVGQAHSDWLKAVEQVEKTEGRTLNKDERWALADKVDPSGMLKKYIKDMTPQASAFDDRKQTGIENQRVVGNKLAEERLALGRQNYDLSAGKDFRTDQQEYGKRLVDLQSVDVHLKPIEEKINSGKVDLLSSKVFGNSWGQFAQNLAGSDPELSSELGYLAAAYIKMISGAAVNEGEAVRLLGTVGVNLWSSPEKMKAGIQGMRNELDAKQNILDNSYDRIRDHYRAKDQKPTAPAPSPASPKKETPAERMKRLGL